jgi:hypothetical protein
VNVIICMWIKLSSFGCIVYGYINQCVTMWSRTVDSLDHSMGLWLTPQSHASFARMKAEAARLWTKPLVCRCYIQWLYNVCATCDTYVVIWMFFIISEQMVIILYIEVIQLTLMCYCKRKIFSAVNLYSDDVVVDITTIRGNQNFHLCFFVKVRVVTTCAFRLTAFRSSETLEIFPLYFPSFD